MNKMKVVIFGLGEIGLRTTKQLLEKKSFEIVGIIDIDQNKVGKDLSEYLDLAKGLNIKISDKPELMFKDKKPNAVILTTASKLKVIFDQIKIIVENNINIVSSCEELSNPWSENYELAKKIDKLAKDNNVSVIGTGINPGFLMDSFVLNLTAISKDIEHITVERYQDAQYRRIPFQNKIGAGLKKEEFNKKLSTGNFGHVGLKESMQIIDLAIDWQLDKIEEFIEPVILEENLKLDNINIEKGLVSGIKQVCHGYKDGVEKIKLVFKANVGEGKSYDRVYIKGNPIIDNTINGGINGDIGTCAILINTIKATIKARSGLLTMNDISVSYTK